MPTKKWVACSDNKTVFRLDALALSVIIIIIIIILYYAQSSTITIKHSDEIKILKYNNTVKYSKISYAQPQDEGGWVGGCLSQPVLYQND